MIPQFPEFKKLELSDKEDVEKFTKQFPPYSDFNFVSMWSWDTKGEMGLSELNGNLVVKFSDYLTAEPLLGFIGTNEATQTADMLLAYAKEEKMMPILKLIPEETARLIDPTKFLIEEDRNNFDYICDIDQLKTFEGAKFKQKRNEVNFLLASHPHAIAKEVDLKNPDARKSITTLFHKWAAQKIQEGKEFELHEGLAFYKLLMLSEQYPLVCVGVFLGEYLAAFMICEVSEAGYAMGQASKSDSQIKGTNAFLMKAMSEIMSSYGRRFFNYEQDLGLAHLRDGKTRFRPAFFLKKFTVASF
jgi:hypothetical protein